MTLDTIEPDRAELIALLQPFIDGELDDRERERVAAQIAANPEYQAMVREQQQVRALLRSLDGELAPPGLRARVLADLDEVDGERGGSGFLAPVVGRIKAFGRGSMLMVPAAAAAVLLFFTVRSGALDDMMGDEPVDGVHVDGGMAGTLKPGQRSAEQDFTVQVAPPRALPAGVALVSDDPQVSPASVVRYRDGEGRLFVDTQRAAPTAVPTGTRQVFRGHPYYLDRDGEGRIRVEFGVGPVYHSLVLHAVGSGAGAGSTLNVDEAEVAAVLAVAEALRNAHGQ